MVPSYWRKAPSKMEQLIPLGPLFCLQAERKELSTPLLSPTWRMQRSLKALSPVQALGGVAATRTSACGLASTRIGACGFACTRTGVCGFASTRTGACGFAFITKGLFPPTAARALRSAGIGLEDTAVGPDGTVNLSSYGTVIIGAGPTGPRLGMVLASTAPGVLCDAFQYR